MSNCPVYTHRLVPRPPPQPPLSPYTTLFRSSEARSHPFGNSSVYPGFAVAVTTVVPPGVGSPSKVTATAKPRSEEHTSELQSRGHLVCRLLLEKDKTYTIREQQQKLIEEDVG